MMGGYGWGGPFGWGRGFGWGGLGWFGLGWFGRGLYRGNPTVTKTGYTPPAEKPIPHYGLFARIRAWFHMRGKW
jgi:hypothetical protein